MMITNGNEDLKAADICAAAAESVDAALTARDEARAWAQRLLKERDEARRIASEQNEARVKAEQELQRLRDQLAGLLDNENASC